MTKEYLITLCKYNIWANNVVKSWLLQIDDAQWNATVVSSFDTIAKTCIHTAGAEKIWLERWQSKKDISFLINEFTGNKNELIAIWENASTGILHFIKQIEEAHLNNSFSFTRINGEMFSNKYNEAIIHVLNHSTYHRGQIVNMLRQVGFTNVSSTDMITFFRD
jgi:uncharacterized damage-inducible protein DinB